MRSRKRFGVSYDDEVDITEFVVFPSGTGVEENDFLGRKRQKDFYDLLVSHPIP